MEVKSKGMREMPIEYFCKICNSFQPIQKSELGGVAKDISMVTLECGHEFIQPL
jgi:hypothetical protein